ncbi:endonuclease III [Halodesulfurarchaeum formicicum]|uniref:Endonuclease III n=1 Tax=Halodesulfurarchaeum formicicum TaxID=1873524 RepID=A0A1D8S4E1_9EURY|nr:endonuclease III [Halodesulfurarchaeum formicicum]AOW80221.1 endonuclease III [Halodesulfurarchaeum formicicum]APE95522.1 endonuclease III [Halodesulfurarchaeum formicicum]
MGIPRDSRSEQAAVVIDRLREAYPEATISLDFENRLELLIAVVLSAQCPDERVNEVTETLFEQYRTPADYAAADPDDIADIIGSCTYPNNKAEYLVGIGEQLLAEHDGAVPDSMDELTDLPGVGRKTANVVLQHGHDTVAGIVVDTHVQRLSRRLGLTDEERPEKIEADLQEILPEEDWKLFTHWLIAHGRAVCTARSPDCETCFLEDICPSSRLE